MAGKWHGFVPTKVDERDKPRVVEYPQEIAWGFPTKEAAVAYLRRDLTKKRDAARVELAQLDRALDHLNTL
jgi:hypothetical protein